MKATWFADRQHCSAKVELWQEKHSEVKNCTFYSKLVVVHVNGMRKCL
jgi:hypothetical protein